MSEAQTGHEVHEQHDKLVRALADQHARTVVQHYDEVVPDEEFDVLMERARALMAYEKQMPSLLAEPERLRSEKVIFWSWRAQSAMAIALIIAFRLLGYSDGWYALGTVSRISGRGWGVGARLAVWAVGI
ncbi:hypothetical protein AB0O74_32620 [Streptomyces rubiginosohelvolus]|uniref:hypothetical protein n=1 Tax=Streptomyces rubiginosohelvolus TaxID=67362 RepID=UPI0034453712